MTAIDSTAAAKKARRAEYQKQWRERNKEYFAAYYIANRAKIREKQALAYREKAEEYKARAVAWSRANKERRYEIADKYRRENRDLYRAATRRDYERNKGLWLARGAEFRAKNRALMRELTAAWKAAHPEANAHHVGLRRTRRMQATPAWADLNAIKAIYKRAAELRRETGEKWHVDHEIPLKHPLVCGLHNEFNLCVIPATVNQSKGNRLADER